MPATNEFFYPEGAWMVVPDLMDEFPSLTYCSLLFIGLQWCLSCGTLTYQLKRCKTLVAGSFLLFSRQSSTTLSLKCLCAPNHQILAKSSPPKSA